MALPKLTKASRKPTPFSRPGINLDKPERTWQKVRAIDLTLEDLVPDLGLITDATLLGGTEYIKLTGAGGKERVFVPSELVFAFTTAK